MAKQNTSTFEDFINELEKKANPETCSVDNPDDCDSCGS